MSVTGYAIGALAVMLLPVALVVPSLAAHGLIRPLRASLGDAVAVMAVAGLLSAAAAVTADVCAGMMRRMSKPVTGPPTWWPWCGCAPRPYRRR